MCDELIVGHGMQKDGGFLPDLDVRKTLVPTSGKKFAPTHPEELRASWDRAQEKALDASIKTWHLIGPFPGMQGNRKMLGMTSTFEKDFLKSKDGAVDLKARYLVAGEMLPWKKVTADRKGVIDLISNVAKQEWCVAYAYTEINEVHGRETLLSCGSDDGIVVWVNGKEVHRNEIGRGYSAGSDSCSVYLKPGTNRILLKVAQYVGGWAFGVSIPKATF